MNVNELGTYASIIALIVMAIGGAVKLVNKYRTYVIENDKADERYINLVVGAVEESTTAVERADSAYYVQQVLASERHLITVTYIQIVIFILVGVAAFNVFTYFGEWLISGVFLLGAFLYSVINYLYVREIEKRINKLETKATVAFADNVDKTFLRKAKRKTR